MMKRATTLLLALLLLLSVTACGSKNKEPDSQDEAQHPSSVEPSIPGQDTPEPEPEPEPAPVVREEYHIYDPKVMP